MPSREITNPITHAAKNQYPQLMLNDTPHLLLRLGTPDGRADSRAPGPCTGSPAGVLQRWTFCNDPRRLMAIIRDQRARHDRDRGFPLETLSVSRDLFLRLVQHFPHCGQLLER
jgi:hypothetical protein